MYNNNTATVRERFSKYQDYQILCFCLTLINICYIITYEQQTQFIFYKEIKMANEHNQTVMVEVLKDGGVAVDMAPKLLKKIEFLEEMKDIARNSRNKEAKVFAEETETQARMLFKQLAVLANEAYPNEKQISDGSLGLLEETVSRYKFTLVISKR